VRKKYLRHCICPVYASPCVARFAGAAITSSPRAQMFDRFLWQLLFFDLWLFDCATVRVGKYQNSDTSVLFADVLNKWPKYFGEGRIKYV